MSVNFKHRSKELEMMDDPNTEKEALKKALSDISKVNRWLGGNNITIKAIHRLIKKVPTSKEIIICDLGCGDGEMLRIIAEIFRRKKRNVKLIGIDLNEKSLQSAKKMSESYPEISFFKQNILEIDASKFSCDIIISTLTLHHFDNEQIKEIVQKSFILANKAVIINDLHRSVIAYYLFKIFSFFFIKSYIAKNDGLVSIKRGFNKQELLQFSKEINVSKYMVDWKWAFRFRWILIKE
ncbi:methyltransferase [Aquimarina muelleri]|uniref:Methyltransferase domain-containing protein n=1 Tax=Aquimarina muelleri TaxID=279356 RepID=A0A918JS90_9FLAO|nr:methyltransferase [Aquimarina muelleri]MCX2763064.1 methyltransferase [Aquimarina muelleri]GGX03056.1 hypothetical protein GCM10007384_01000 [Aquimarina muelleri]